MRTNDLCFYQGRPCLKVFNAEGDELSLSGITGKTSLAIFPKGENRTAREEILFVTPETLLRMLAEHLGYTVSRKRAKP